MISKFLSSRFSGYIAIAGVVGILALVYYIYNEGKQSCKGNAAIEQNVKAQETERQSENVRKKVQSFDEIQLNNELCRLGIMRGGKGCESQ